MKPAAIDLVGQFFENREKSDRKMRTTSELEQNVWTVLLQLRYAIWNQINNVSETSPRKQREFHSSGIHAGGFHCSI